MTKFTFVLNVVSVSSSRSAGLPFHSNYTHDPISSFSKPPAPVLPAPQRSLMSQPSIGYLTKCLVTNLDIHDDDGLLFSFRTIGAEVCSQYCLALTRCEIVSFHFLTGMCLLFSDHATFTRDLGTEVAQSVAMFKSCVEEERSGVDILTTGASILLAVSLSHTGTGFYIQQRSVRNQDPMCLAIGEEITASLSSSDGENESGNEVEENTNFSEDLDIEVITYTDTTKNPLGDQLIWVSCAKGTRWSLHEVDNSEIRNLESLNVSLLYRIQPTNSPEKCVDAIVNESNFSQAILRKCIKSLKSQLMYLEPSSLSMSNDSYSIFSAPEKNLQLRRHGRGHPNILHTGSFRTSKLESLFAVKFVDPAKLQTRSCSLLQLSTHHGTVRNENNLPFILPGHVVEVQCDPGYGVRSLNYSGIQTVVCTDTSTPLPCRRIESKKKKPCKSRGRGTAGTSGRGVKDLTLMVAVVSSVLVVILAVALAVTLGRRKKSGN